MQNFLFPKAVVVGSVFACIAVGTQAAPVPSGAPGEAVVTGEPSRYGGPSQFRPTFTIPSLGTSIAIGGFVKVDAWYDMDYDQGATANPYTLPLREETDGRFGSQVIESRLNFRSSSETDIGRIDTVIEFDFLDATSPGENVFNLRHAYGELGNFLVGHTWTNTWSPVGSLRNLKYGSAPGTNWGTRQTQLRYTLPIGKNQISVSLEDPAGVGDAVAGEAGNPENPLPDLTARFQMGRTLVLAAMARRIETRDNAEEGISDMSTMGYAAIAQAQYPILSSTVLKGTLWWGEGIASYVPAGSTAGPGSLRDAYVDGSSLEAVRLVGGHVGIEQTWTQRWSSTFGYSRIEQEDIPVGNFADETEYSFASLWWEPVPRFSWAVEYQFARNKRQDGDTRNASRIQTSAILQF